MNAKNQSNLSVIFEGWRGEEGELEVCVDALRDWMQEVNQLGIPHFGETATRLRPLRERLLTHFERENEIVEQLSNLYTSPSPEVDAVRRQSVRDHDQLLQRLDELIGRLDQTVPPFDSWEQAINQVEIFVGVLEQHKDQEAESFGSLIPSDVAKAK